MTTGHTAPTELRISASATRAFAECPYRYALDHVRRLPRDEREAVPAIAFGEAVHKALAQFIRQGGWAKKSSDDLVEMLMRHWDSRPFGNEDASMEQFQRARELLENYYDSPFPDPGLVVRDLGVEAYLTWAGSRRGILAVGKVDRAVQMSDGRVVIIDYKTGRRKLGRRELATDLQAIFYRSIAADVYRYLEPTGIEVVFHYLDGPMPAAIDFTREEFDRGWSHIQAIVTEIRAALCAFREGAPMHAAFGPCRGDACRTCPFRRHCDGLVASGVLGSEPGAGSLEDAART